MKKIFLLLPLLAPAQSTQEVTDVLQQIVEEGGIYYVVTTTKFAAGPPQVIPTKIGGRQEMITYAQTEAVNRQQAIAAARRVVIEDAPTAFRQFTGLDTLIRTITGGDTTLYDLNAATYFDQYQGRYRLRSQSGTTDYTGSITGTHATSASFTSGGKLIQVPEKWGAISTSTDGSGDIVVAHGMGVTPTHVSVQVTGLSGSAVPYIAVVLYDETDATNFTVRFYDMTGAAVTSTAVTATWHAKT